MADAAPRRPAHRVGSRDQRRAAPVPTGAARPYEHAVPTIARPAGGCTAALVDARALCGGPPQAGETGRMARASTCSRHHRAAALCKWPAIRSDATGSGAEGYPPG
jgi:hypothetical protein